jgi:branched-chain amino acid transport system ATP-binding protein
MSLPALETRGLSKSFGALTVANAIDFRLEPGARHALIGPNGAGKTSFVNLVTGVLPPSAGRIFVNGADVTALPQAARVKRGLVRTFQITQLCPRLNVIENVTLAVCERRGLGGNLWRPAGRHRAAIEEAYALLEQMGLAEEALRPVATLAYGQQRLTEIAVALGLAPKVLLLDEPAAGVPSGESGRIINAIEQLHAEIALLIIDHDMDLVFRLARRITVLVQGRVLVEGTPAEIAADPRCGGSISANGRRVERRRVGAVGRVGRLWRNHRAGGDRARPAAGRDPGTAWAQRGRQDDLAGDDHGAYPAARRLDPLCRL